MSVLAYFSVIILLIVLIGVINEKLFHIQGDIALLLFSVLIGTIIGIAGCVPGASSLAGQLKESISFDFEAYLLEGVLCFMLFAGSSKVSINKFRQNLKMIGLLALLSTILSSVVYGVLFFCISFLFGLRMDLWVCILLGCIVSPTDPIAATGILNKLGMSKNVTSVIECESLFNDGTGVALFLFLKGIVSQRGGGNFFYIMGKELFGAIFVAILSSVLLFGLLRLTADPLKHILISLANVMLVYVVCEHLGFSGVIASVVCGMCFAYMRGKIVRRLAVQDPEDRYQDFWEVADGILNSILFVVLGLSIVNASPSRYLPILIPFGILILLLSRCVGVAASGMLMGKGHLPGNYNLPEFSALMTWSALKGGLSLALALSCRELLSEQTFQIVVNMTYITILFTVLVQGLTCKKAYLMIEQRKLERIKRKKEQREGIKQ